MADESPANEAIWRPNSAGERTIAETSKAREFIFGVAAMFDFMGVLRRTRHVATPEQNMARAWQRVMERMNVAETEGVADELTLPQMAEERHQSRGDVNGLNPALPRSLAAGTIFIGENLVNSALGAIRKRQISTYGDGGNVVDFKLLQVGDTHIRLLVVFVARFSEGINWPLDPNTMSIQLRPAGQLHESATRERDSPPTFSVARFGDLAALQVVTGRGGRGGTSLAYLAVGDFARQVAHSVRRVKWLEDILDRLDQVLFEAHLAAARGETWIVYKRVDEALNGIEDAAALMLDKIGEVKE